MSPHRTIAVLGLGEAGSVLASALAQAGAEVRGFDPRVAAPAGVRACGDAAQACAGASVVLSVNGASHALAALAEGLPGCTPETIWADLNTAAPSVKQAIERAAGDLSRVVDVALMAPVPLRGLGTPMTVSGPAAGAFATVMRPLGAVVEVIEGPVGAAATHKLLRSVFLKGLAATVIEALSAARAAGLEDWLRAHIVEELTAANVSTLDRLESGSRAHAVRRTHEMEAAAQLLDDLGVPARVTRASRDWLADLAAAAQPSIAPTPRAP